MRGSLIYVLTFLQGLRSGKIYESYCSSWSVLDGLEMALCKLSSRPTSPFEWVPLFLEKRKQVQVKEVRYEKFSGL